MSEERLKRKLVAIVHADVVGYSRLSGSDEERTHRALSAALALVRERVAGHGGRVVNTAGDAFLADFGTATDALLCAVEIQQRLHEDEAEPVIRFRIGVNLGEVIVDGDDIFGDGVNVAARLQACAEPGGICVSQSVRSAVGNRVDLDFRDLGSQRVKNIADPVRVWAVGGAAGVATTGSRRWSRYGAAAVVAATAVAASAWLLTAEQSPPPSATGEPAPGVVSAPVAAPASAAAERRTTASIAVLPFANLNRDPSEDYFVDGITNDIITDLSQLSGLFVIASNSVFVYKGTPVKVQQVGRELGVGFVLEGSVQKAGDRVRINAQLIDAQSGHHVWADRYDRQMTDIFALQDEVSQEIVTALAVELTAGEERRLSNSRTANPEAYDLLLRGLELFRRFTRETNNEAREYFQRAVATDPDFARGHADIALSYAMALQFGWLEPTEKVVSTALRHGEAALALDPGVRQVHFALCSLYTVLKRHDEAIAAGREAIRVDPNYADGYANLAQALNYAGQPDESLRMMQRAVALNPKHAFFYTWIIGQSHMLKGDYPTAIALMQEVIERNAFFPGAHLLLAAIYGNLGRVDEARWVAAELAALQPDISVAREAALAPYRDPGQLQWYIEGLRRAGLPE